MLNWGVSEILKKKEEKKKGKKLSVCVPDFKAVEAETK